MVQAVNLAQQAGQTKQHLSWLQALAALEVEQGDYATAIQHYQTAENLALRLGDQPPEFFMRSALELTTAYQLIGNNEQAEVYATRALARARSTHDAKHEALALTKLGMAAYGRNDLAQAQSFLTEALAHYDNGTITGQNEYIQMVIMLGNVAMRQGRIDTAAQFTEKALALAREEGSPAREADVLNLMGNLAARQHDFGRALGHWQDALKLLDNDYRKIAQVRCDMAHAHKASGNYSAALNEYERALVTLNQIDHPPTRGLVLSNAATLYTETGEIDTAQAFYEEAIDIAQQTGDLQAESVRVGNLGWFFSLTGRPQRAIDLLERALAISRDLDDTLMVGVQTNNLARTYVQLKDYPAARALHKQAIAAATAVAADRWLAVFQSDMAETLIALDRKDEAETLLKAALETAQQHADLETTIKTQARLAALYARTERLDQAGALATEAAERARKMRYKRGMADAAAALGDVARLGGHDDSDQQQAQQHYAEAHRLYTVLHDPAAKAIATYVE
jgi:tetratricopeptide (TPR) repeat protein